MKKNVLITVEFNGESAERQIHKIDRWLLEQDAIQVMPTQWALLPRQTVEQIEQQLRIFVDPADRLLVSRVSAMSSRSPINEHRVGLDAA